MPKAVSKARATSAKSFDLPVPGGPDTSTLRERASSFKACLQSSLAIAVPTCVCEVSVADYRLICRAHSIQTIQKLLGYHGVPSTGGTQGPLLGVVRPYRPIVQLDEQQQHAVS